MKKFLLTISLCLIFICSTFLVSCKNNTEGTTDDDAGSSAATQQTETEKTGVVESINTITSALTDDQKNIALPTTYTDWSELTTKITKKGIEKYVISASGNYYFGNSDSSTLELSKQISVEADDVHIYFGDVNITYAGNKCISSDSDCSFTMTILSGKTLTLNNISTETDTDKNAISADANIIINGSGTINITSNKSGIKSNDGVYIIGTTINITANYSSSETTYNGHGVSGSFVYIDGATINVLKCGKDGIHAEMDDLTSTFSYSDGFVYITNNAIINIAQASDSYCYGDGIQADSFVYISSGTVNIKTTPTWTQATSSDGCFSKSGSTYTKVASDSVGTRYSNYYQLSNSVKGIKVGEIDYYLTEEDADAVTNVKTITTGNYLIYITGGSLTINSTDDCIHTNYGDVVITGGNLTLSTSDDAIHADQNLEISGSANITITTSFEGVEANQIKVLGGTLKITATDDGINAAACTESTTPTIVVSGGFIDIAVNGSDVDGIDSNGTYTQTGGIVITRGGSGASTGLDCDNSITISGGTLIVLGNIEVGTPGAGGRPGSQSGASITTGSGVKSYSLSLHSSGSHSIQINGTSYTISNSRTYSRTYCYSSVSISA